MHLAAATCGVGTTCIPVDFSLLSLTRAHRQQSCEALQLTQTILIASHLKGRDNIAHAGTCIIELRHCQQLPGQNLHILALLSDRAIQQQPVPRQQLTKEALLIPARSIDQASLVLMYARPDTCACRVTHGFQWELAPRAPTRQLQGQQAKWLVLPAMQPPFLVPRGTG